MQNLQLNKKEQTKTKNKKRNYLKDTNSQNFITMKTSFVKLTQITLLETVYKLNSLVNKVISVQINLN